MSEFFNQLYKFAKESPEAQRILAGAVRDGLSVAKIPATIHGNIKRGLAEVAESATGIVQSGANLVNDYGPELQFGEKGPEISLLDPMDRYPDADKVSEVAGRVKEGFSTLSDSPTIVESVFDTAIGRMDERIGRSEAGGGDKEAEETEEQDPRASNKTERRANRRARKQARRSAKAPPKAVEVYDDELEGIRDPAQPSRAAILAGDKPAPESEVDYSDEAMKLFKNTHGTSFDPKSSMDRGKLEVMKDLLEEQGGLGKMTPNQFALQVYRNP